MIPQGFAFSTKVAQFSHSLCRPEMLRNTSEVQWVSRYTGAGVYLKQPAVLEETAALSVSIG